MINGFLRVAAVAPDHRVADVDFNVERIIDSIHSLEELGVDVAVFPELCITGYTCGDLFLNASLLDNAEKGLKRIAECNAKMHIDVIVGLPMICSGSRVSNCAALVSNGNVEIVKKNYLSSNERRWFSSSDDSCLAIFESHGAKIGIEFGRELLMPIPQSSHLALGGAHVIFNLSAIEATVGKLSYLSSVVSQQSARCNCAYVYASAGFGESSTDMAYLPQVLIAENGVILESNNPHDFLSNPTVVADVDVAAISFDRLKKSEIDDCVIKNNVITTFDGLICDCDDITILPKYRVVNSLPFLPLDKSQIDEKCSEISAIQFCGLARRLKAVGSNRIVVGISGGLDSTLALLVAAHTIKCIGGDVKDIIGVTMPGFGTTDRTYDNALKLMKLLGITMREISIVNAVKQHFNDIGHDLAVHDVTYENSQARERTQILMDVANQVGGIVLGTGDLSELALGWATYNGDHMSMYGVNADVPKTLIRYVVKWYADNANDNALREVLYDIIDTPISPELTPADESGNIKQKTEDLVGPYELHDFFIFYTLRYGFTPGRIFILARKAFENAYDESVIKKWMKVFYRRFFNQQFKRSCLPDGPKVGSVGISPRGDLRMPSDASSALWLKAVDEL